MDTIHDISAKTNAGADFYIRLDDFLDSFYRTSEKEKAEMIAAAPDDMEKPEYVPFLASTEFKHRNLFVDENVLARV